MSSRLSNPFNIRELRSVLDEYYPSLETQITDEDFPNKKPTFRGPFLMDQLPEILYDDLVSLGIDTSEEKVNSILNKFRNKIMDNFQIDIYENSGYPYEPYFANFLLEDYKEVPFLNSIVELLLDKIKYYKNGDLIFIGMTQTGHYRNGGYYFILKFKVGNKKHVCICPLLGSEEFDYGTLIPTFNCFKYSKNAFLYGNDLISYDQHYSYKVSDICKYDGISDIADEESGYVILRNAQIFNENGLGSIYMLIPAYLFDPKEYEYYDHRGYLNYGFAYIYTGYKTYIIRKYVIENGEIQITDKEEKFLVDFEV